MKTLMQALLISGAVAIASTAIAPAFAEMGISFNVGDVTLAYRDGYWDRDHHWHKWRNDDDWKSFRNQHPEHYKDYNHDRGHDDHGH